MILGINPVISKLMVGLCIEKLLAFSLGLNLSLIDSQSDLLLQLIVFIYYLGRLAESLHFTQLKVWCATVSGHLRIYVISKL